MSTSVGIDSSDRHPHLDQWSVGLVLEPQVQRLILRVCIGRKEMLDLAVGRGDKHGLGVAQRAEAGLSVLVTHARGAGPAARHRLDEEMDIYLVHSAAAEGKLANEPV